MEFVIISAALFAAALAGLALLGKILASLRRLEAALGALSARLGHGELRSGKDEAADERYARGVANILAYGTREMLGRGGAAQ